MLFKKKDKAKKGAEAEAAAPEAADKPADGAEGAEGEGDAPKKKKGLPIKLIAIGLVAVLVLGGGGGAAWFFLLKPKPTPEQVAQAALEKAKEKKKEKKKDKEKGGGKEGEGGGGVITEGPDGVYYYALPTVMVNMQTADGRPTFLKLDLIFEVSDEAIGEEIEPSMPRLQDMLQTFLRELRPEDLSGSQGSYRLRQEIQRRVNLLIAPAKVDTVLIGGMLIN